MQYPAYHAGELFSRMRIGFMVTNLETPGRAVARFYNKRGTAEQWIKEGKQAAKTGLDWVPCLMSKRRFVIDCKHCPNGICPRHTYAVAWRAL